MPWTLVAIVSLTSVSLCASDASCYAAPTYTADDPAVDEVSVSLLQESVHMASRGLGPAAWSGQEALAQGTWPSMLSGPKVEKKTQEKSKGGDDGSKAGKESGKDKKKTKEKAEKKHGKDEKKTKKTKSKGGDDDSKAGKESGKDDKKTKEKAETKHGKDEKKTKKKKSKGGDDDSKAGKESGKDEKKTKEKAEQKHGKDEKKTKKKKSKGGDENKAEKENAKGEGKKSRKRKGGERRNRRRRDSTENGKKKLAVLDDPVMEDFVEGSSALANGKETLAHYTNSIKPNPAVHGTEITAKKKEQLKKAAAKAIAVDQNLITRDNNPLDKFSASDAFEKSVNRPLYDESAPTHAPLRRKQEIATDWAWADQSKSATKDANTLLWLERLNKDVEKDSDGKWDFLKDAYYMAKGVDKSKDAK